MNEIITKLNEIEEKAGAILSDAGERKDTLMAQLQKEEQEIDAGFDRMLEEERMRLTAKLQAEARLRISGETERIRQAMEELDARFCEEKEQLAEAIFRRMIGT